VGREGPRKFSLISQLIAVQPAIKDGRNQVIDKSPVMIENGKEYLYSFSTRRRVYKFQDL
jgi:hypothetical protein